MADKPIPEELTMQDMYQHGVRVGHQECEVILGRVEQTVESQRKLLDKYDADNTKLVLENAKLKALVKRLNAPVRNDEWLRAEGSLSPHSSFCFEIASSLIAARLAGEEEQHA